MLAKGRNLSLPKQVAAAGGIAAWNEQSAERSALCKMMNAAVTATTVEEVSNTQQKMGRLAQLMKKLGRTPF